MYCDVYYYPNWRRHHMVADTNFGIHNNILSSYHVRIKELFMEGWGSTNLYLYTSGESLFTSCIGYLTAKTLSWIHHSFVH